MMLTDEDLVRDALKALRHHDAQEEASANIEVRIIRRFRAHRARRQMKRWGWLVAAAAVAAFFLIERPQQVSLEIPQVPGAPIPPAIPPAIPPSVAKTRPQVTVAGATPINSPVQAIQIIRLPKMAAAKIQQASEVVTEFYPLLDPEPPFERGQILRVRVPASAMRAVGLAVRDEHLQDPVQADVVVGEEGMLRAIRFVGFQRK